MRWWDKLKALSMAFAAVLVPIVLAVVGSGYNRAIKEREVQGKFVELAVSILTRDPSDPERDLRIWATGIIDAYSGVRLGDTARADLVERIALQPDRSLSLSGLYIRELTDGVSQPLFSDTMFVTIIGERELYHSNVCLTLDGRTLQCGLAMGFSRISFVPRDSGSTLAVSVEGPIRGEATFKLIMEGGGYRTLFYRPIHRSVAEGEPVFFARIRIRRQEV
jgi:hypothetical protein